MEMYRLNLQTNEESKLEDYFITEQVFMRKQMNILFSKSVDNQRHVHEDDSEHSHN